jgi:uncharacterized membrane protein
MPRTIETTLPAGETAALVEQLRQMDGVLGIDLLRGAALKPPGDILRLQITNRTYPDLMRLFAQEGIGTRDGTSLSASEPVSVVSLSARAAIANDSSEASWEEMEQVIGKNSNMTLSALLVMGIAGVMATVGIATNALHLVLAAMLIAPGFQPIVRVMLGVCAQSPAWRRGIRDILLGYGCMILAAAVTSWILILLGKSPVGGESSYLPPYVLISYWSNITPMSELVSLVASVGGALLIASNRAVLTAGVMVGLALVPGATLIGIGIGTGLPDLAFTGLQRWLLELANVLVGSLLVFGTIRLLRQRQRMLP